MAVTRLWVDAWRVASQPDASVEDLADLTSPDVADRLIATLQGDGVPRAITNTPSVGDPTEDGSVPIDDCLLLSPPVTAVSANWYSGVAQADADGTLRLTALEPESLVGCVPGPIAEAAIADYEDYWDAAVEYWVPADPTNPRLAETTTGAHFDLIFDLVTEHAAEGWELRGRPETHPEIFEYRSPAEVVIVDCQLTDPERGLYVSATGERLPDIAPIAPDQRDARQSTMVFVEGRWKMSDRQGQTNFECQFAPSPLGIPVVGREE